MNITKKLHSSRGATMIYALAALLIITIVSFLVISSATVNVGRVQKSQEEQQAYLNVSSAAGLVQKAINEEAVEVSVKNVDQYVLGEDDPNHVRGPIITTKSLKVDASDNSVDPFAPILTDWVQKIVTKDSLLYDQPTVPEAHVVMTQTVNGKVQYIRVALKMEKPVHDPATGEDEYEDLKHTVNGFKLHVVVNALKPANEGVAIDLTDPETYVVSGDYAMSIDYGVRISRDVNATHEYTTIGVGPDEKEVDNVTTVETITVQWTAGKITKGGTI